MSMTTLGTANRPIEEHPDSPRSSGNFRDVQRAVTLAANEHGMVNIRILASKQDAKAVLNQTPQDRVVSVRADIAIERIRQGIAELVTQ
jgi:hypothetical protein